MHRRLRHLPTWLALGAAWLALVSDAAGTSYVVPSDEWLVGQVPIIAEVSVMSVSDSPAPGTPSTDLIVLVKRLFKGRLAGTSVVVRIPGGIGPDGIGLRVAGAPQLTEGETAVLFLTPRKDGTYGVFHFGLGVFRRTTESLEGADQALAVRDLAGPQGAAIDPPRDWEAFLGWLGAESGASGDYLVPAGEPVLRQSERVASSLPPLAWEELGRGRNVAWRWSTEAEGPAPLRVLRRIFDSWTRNGNDLVALRAEAAVELSSAGLIRRDGSNDIARDGDDDLLPGRFSCEEGGLAALSGVWFDPAESFRFRPGPDGKALRALEADIVLNNGAECLFGRGDGGRWGDQVLGHEIGHTLGLGHADDASSMMFPVLVGEGASGRASGSDRKALAGLYASPAQRDAISPE
jgi:hypothetical protein